MKYTPLAIAKPLQSAISQGGYKRYNGYNLPETPPEGAPPRVANVANVATPQGSDLDTLAAYLASLDGPEVLTMPGLPPTPYRVAPWEVWKARGLHGTAWAAWWAAVARQRTARNKTAQTHPRAA